MGKGILNPLILFYFQDKKSITATKVLEEQGISSGTQAFIMKLPLLIRLQQLCSRL